MRAPLAYRDGALRLFGHPLHVLLVHFPLGLWPFVFPLELIAWLAGWDLGWRIAFWANVAGTAMAVPTAATGLIDLAAVAKRPEAASHANLHMAAMLAAAALFGGELCFHSPRAAIAAPGAFVNLGLTAGGMLALMWGGWLGGELVLRHGAGRIIGKPDGSEGKAA
jgi:uncharacterized membrane protein